MPEPQRYFFRKNERLCLNNDIANVVENGEKFMSYPLLANYVVKNTETCEAVKIAVSVAKRNFKKAVDRNLLKRRIREAYRHNKHYLTCTAKKHSKTVNAIIIYVPKEKLPYRSIEKGIAKLLGNIAKNIEKHSDISTAAAD